MRGERLPEFGIVGLLLVLILCSTIGIVVAAVMKVAQVVVEAYECLKRTVERVYERIKDDGETGLPEGV